MSSEAPIPTSLPAQIGGYEILSELSLGQSYLAVAPGSRVVVSGVPLEGRRLAATAVAQLTG